MEFVPGLTIKGGTSTYLLIENCGGGANEAFKAEDTNKKRPVFFKAYSSSPKKTNPRFNIFRDLQAEIPKRLSDIRESTEITIEDFIIEEIYCSVKEWCPGKSLDKIIEIDLQSFTPIKALALASVFLGVLEAVHERGVIHTDLKPQNLFCEEATSGLGWKLKVIDFDMSHVEGREPFATAGTMLYWSPEHIHGKKPTKATDVFTAGLILAELLTGGYLLELPAEVEEEHYNDAVMKHRLEGDVIDSLKTNYRMGPEVGAMIARMTEPDPGKRPSLSEVREALAQAIKAEQTPSPPPIPPYLELHRGAERLVVFEDKKAFTREHFNVFGKDNAGYVSRKGQFEIFKAGDGWKIKGAVAPGNPTLLNDKDVSGSEAVLKEGDIIQIGPLQMTVKFPAIK
jgi:serine/threonine protein kinase